ncbi:MAG: Na+/H+ antiporter subunit E [Actinomycetota bacterium]
MRHVLGSFGVRRLLLIVGLVAAWCALWHRVSFANVASGLLVAVVVSSPIIGPPAVGGVKLVPLLKFGALVGRDLVLSTFNVAYEVITPTDYTEEAIIGVDLPGNARAHMMLIAVAVTVTPGTAVIDVDPDRSRIYLHILHAERADATADHVEELAELACQALPMPSRTEASS